jgi:hypothetical protein
VRWRFLPPGAQVHSKPWSVVKTPGRFLFSAAAVGLDALLRARLGHLVPALTLRIRQQRGAAGANLVRDPHVLRMVGDRDPIQRPVLLESNTVVHHDFPAGGHPEQILGGQRHPEHPGVEGVPGVDVRHAPVHLVRKRLPDVRRELPAAGDR